MRIVDTQVSRKNQPKFKRQETQKSRNIVRLIRSPLTWCEIIQHALYYYCYSTCFMQDVFV